MCVLSMIYSCVAVCKFCAVLCLLIIGFSLLFSSYSTYVIQYSIYVYFCFAFLFCVFCVFVLFSILFCVLFLLLCCLFPISVQVYRPLPPGGNTAVSKYHIICHVVLRPQPTHRASSWAAYRRGCEVSTSGLQSLYGFVCSIHVKHSCYSVDLNLYDIFLLRQYHARK